MKIDRLMPTMWLLVAIVAEVILHLVLPITKIVPRYWNLLGIIPLALGVAINLLADRAFREANTTVKPFETSTVLLKDGVFGVSRNPMYLGFVLVLIGIAVLLRSLTPYLVVIGLAVLMQRVYIVVEESTLAAQFGAEWAQYRRRTRRWL